MTPNTHTSILHVLIDSIFINFLSRIKNFYRISVWPIYSSIKYSYSFLRESFFCKLLRVGWWKIMPEDEFIVTKFLFNIWDKEMIWKSGLIASLIDLFKKQTFSTSVADIEPQNIPDWVNLTLFFRVFGIISLIWLSSGSGITITEVNTECWFITLVNHVLWKKKTTNSNDFLPISNAFVTVSVLVRGFEIDILLSFHSW